MLITAHVQSCLPSSLPPPLATPPPFQEGTTAHFKAPRHACNPGICTVGLSRKTPWVMSLIWAGCNMNTHWQSAQEKWAWGYRGGRGGVTRGRREVEPVHMGQDSGRRERSWLLHEKENIKQEKGGEGTSGRKYKRGGAHLHFSQKRKRETGAFELVGVYFLFALYVFTLNTMKSWA